MVVKFPVAATFRSPLRADLALPEGLLSRAVPTWRSALRLEVGATTGGQRYAWRVRYGEAALRVDGKRYHAAATYLVSVNSSRPSWPPSRPMPLCFIPPKGAAGSETRP